MPITVVLDAQLKPDSLEAAYAGIHETLLETRERPGCLGVDVIIDAKDPAHLVAIEHWESRDDQRAYLAWRGEGHPPTGLNDALAAPPSLKVYEDAPQI